MKDWSTVVFALGVVGGLVFLLERGVETTKDFLLWNWARKTRRDLLAVCERNNFTITSLQIDEGNVQGVLHSGELSHGFRAMLPEKYHPEAMDKLIAVIAADAGFDYVGPSA